MPLPPYEALLLVPPPQEPGDEARGIVRHLPALGHSHFQSSCLPLRVHGEQEVGGDAHDGQENSPVRVQQEETLSCTEVDSFWRRGVIVHSALSKERVKQ